MARASAKAQRTAEAGVHGMQQMLLELIGADAQHRAGQRRPAARHPRHRDLQIGDGVKPRQRRVVDGLCQQLVIERADRAERFAAAPGGDVEIFQMRATAVINAAAGFGPDAEQRISRREGAGARRHHQLRRQPKPWRRRLIEAALPVTAVTPAGEYHRIEHQRCISIQTSSACMPNRVATSNRRLRCLRNRWQDSGFGMRRSIILAAPLKQ
jgi:hypothetical protein